jgi:hypothetical protein
VKNTAAIVGASEEAHVSGPALEELMRAAARHSRPLPHMVCTFVLAQLLSTPHRSDLRSTAPSLVGPEFKKCWDALVMEGTIGSSESSGPLPQPALTASLTPNPLDSLSSAWRTLTGERLGIAALSRLSSQICSKYGTLSTKNALASARMYRAMFPEGTFFSFANDAHRYSQTMDSASLVWEKFGALEGARLRWLSTWTTAKTLCPADYGADDPYLFAPAASPSFDVKNFARLAGSVELRDALALAASPSTKKKVPAPESLTGIGGLK